MDEKVQLVTSFFRKALLRYLQCMKYDVLVYNIACTAGLKHIISNGNRTEWSPIWSVIVQVINKIGRRFV